jgi:hypothetical protein
MSGVDGGGAPAILPGGGGGGVRGVDAGVLLGRCASVIMPLLAESQDLEGFQNSRSTAEG